MVIVFSSLVVTMLFLLSILNSYDKTFCNYNFCGVQSNVISKDLYVIAAPEGNYTSNPSEQEEDGDDSENDNPPEDLPSVEPPYTPPDAAPPYTPPEKGEAPYVPSGNDNDGDNGDRNNGKDNSDESDEGDNSDGDTTSITPSGLNKTVSNTTNVTETATGGNPIFDALKNIFGGIVGSNP